MQDSRKSLTTYRYDKMFGFVITLPGKCTGADLFTPTFFAYFLCFLGSKIHTTDHYYRTTLTRKSDFAKFSFILMFIMSVMTRNRMMVIVSTVLE